MDERGMVRAVVRKTICAARKEICKLRQEAARGEAARMHTRRQV